MKLSSMKTVSIGNTGVVDKIHYDSIDFQCMHDGSYKAIVPIKLPNKGVGDNRVFTTSVPVVISSETSRNAKGKQRMMLKVTLPYTALNPDAEDPQTTANLFDSRRSGGDITAHIVLSVPKAASDDIRSANGTIAQQCAAAQITAVMRLLGALLSGYVHSPYLIVWEDTGEVLTDTLEELKVGDAPVDDDQDGRPRSSKGDSAPVTIEAITGYNTPGVSMASGRQLGSKIDDPIIRGLNGLEPISETANFVLPAVWHGVPD